MLTRFEIKDGLLTLHHLGTASFLLISPDEATVMRIYNDGQPFSLPGGRLHFMHWTRFFNSSAENLPAMVEIELRGVPAHVWDMDTATQILSDCCLPCGTHPDTANQRNVFHLAAWCSWPGDIPTAIDLEVPEPEVAARVWGVGGS